jgi:two-component system phosphate regulon response regulator PhoB/two-component system alkaline phosphatase synthesis response regulator PhoP
MNKLVVVLDDEKDIVEAILINLEKAGFEAKGFQEFSPFYEFIQKNKPSLIILDIMLPEKDGFEVCKELKKEDNFKDIPIIMLTAKSDEIDRILGLELGADDYVTKPFSVRELVSRVKAVSKRYKTTTNDRSIDVIKIKDDFILDLAKYECYINKKQIKLTVAEFKVLKLLVSKKGHVFSREEILKYLWGEDKIVVDRTIDVHITNLRAKIGKYGKLIENIRGIGYKVKDKDKIKE